MGSNDRVHPVILWRGIRDDNTPLLSLRRQSGGGIGVENNRQTRRETTGLAQVIELFKLILESGSVSLGKQNVPANFQGKRFIVGELSISAW